MNFSVKRFNELSLEEMYSILEVRNEVFVVEQNCVYQDCDGKDRESVHVFNEVDGKITSYARILNKGVSYDEVSIGRVLVNKEFRGQGLAKDLMLRAIKFVVEDMNEDRIRISAQNYLLGFYESLGFKACSEVYLEDGIEHIEMIYVK